MIRKLQIKFIVIIMALMTMVLLFIFGFLNISMMKSGEQQSIRMMHKIAMNDGMMPPKRKPEQPAPPPGEDMPAPQDYFSVKLTSQNEFVNVYSERNLALSQDELAALIDSALEKDRATGKQDGYYFLIQPADDGKLIVFLDSSMESNMMYRLLWTSAGISAASLFVLLIIAIFFSFWVTKPVKKAFASQKRFVADASHELKTPLTVIAANAEVLTGEIGENQWLNYIKAEVVRMNALVRDLLYLAKADSTENVYHFTSFDLSNAIMSVCLLFESIVFEKSKQLALDIEEGIFYKGDENRIKQAVAILLDNAIKNSYDHGEIKVSLKMQSGKRVITVYNTGEGIDEQNRNRIFERFYRGDSSRTRETGGYGLGLSIAKTILNAHKGKITIEGEKGKWVAFLISL